MWYYNIAVMGLLGKTWKAWKWTHVCIKNRLLERGTIPKWDIGGDIPGFWEMRSGYWITEPPKTRAKSRAYSYFYAHVDYN